MNNVGNGCTVINQIETYREASIHSEEQFARLPCGYCCNRIYRPSTCRCASVKPTPPSSTELNNSQTARQARRATVEPYPSKSHDCDEDMQHSQQVQPLDKTEVMELSQMSSSFNDSEKIEEEHLVSCARTCIRLRNFRERPLSGANERLKVSANSSKSAPQLFARPCVDSIRQPYDALFRFHSRYYEKLYDYMTFVLGRFPLPSGASFCRPKSPGNAAATVGSTTVWLGRCDAQVDLEASKYWFSRNRQKLHDQTSSEPRLILHFACVKCKQLCLYPGRSTMSCFDVETKYPVLWMHLLVLLAQVLSGRPLASEHPLMQSLRQSWVSLVTSHLGTCDGSSQWNSSFHNQDSVQVKQRPVSMNLDSGNGPSIQVNVPGQGESLKRRAGSWHSIRLRSSRRQLRKVSSFFLLATRAYPKVSELLLLERELRQHQVFDVFRLDSPGDVSEGATSLKIKSQWNCLYCTRRPSNAIAKAGHRIQAGDILKKTWTTLSPNPSAQLATNAGTVNYKGHLMVRHVPPGSGRLSLWTSRWRLRELRLQPGFLQWARPSWQSFPRGRPPEGSDAEDDNCCTCTSNKTLKINGDSKVRKEVDYIQIPITSVSNVCGVRQKRTGTLEQLEINTDVYGKWRMKPAECKRPRFRQTPVCDSVSRLTNPEPDSQSVTGSDQLMLWMQCLQIAIARANQATEWQYHT